MEYFIGFIVLLGILVFVHEFGHFAVAKLVGVKVLKFSFGFPPTLISRKWGETEYIISWIWLGGYVKLLGDDPESLEKIDPEEMERAFVKKSLPARVAVIIAGPLANFVLAMILFCGLYVFGPFGLASEIGAVMPNGPAMEAGFQKGDRVVAIGGDRFDRWDKMLRLVRSSEGKTLTFTVDRGGQELDLKVTPRLLEPEGGQGKSMVLIGVRPSGARIGFFQALYAGVTSTFDLTGRILTTLVQLVTGEISAKELGGPIAIARVSGESLRAGLLNYIWIISFISINLAIINLLPVPVLDGGHLMFFLIEAITRRPVTGRVREIATMAGLLLLGLLMALVIYNDISNLISSSG